MPFVHSDASIVCVFILARTGEEAVLLPATSSLALPEPPRLWVKCCLPPRASWPAWPSVPWPGKEGGETPTNGPTARWWSDMFWLLTVWGMRAEVCQLLMSPSLTWPSLRRRTPPSRRSTPCSRRRSYGIKKLVTSTKCILYIPQIPPFLRMKTEAKKIQDPQKWLWIFIFLELVVFWGLWDLHEGRSLLHWWGVGVLGFHPQRDAWAKDGWSVCAGFLLVWLENKFSMLCSTVAVVWIYIF